MRHNGLPSNQIVIRLFPRVVCLYAYICLPCNVIGVRVFSGVICVFVQTVVCLKNHQHVHTLYGLSRWLIVCFHIIQFVSKNNCCLCTGHRLPQDQLFVILFVPKTICVVDMLVSLSITCHAITMIFPLYLFVCLLLRYHWSILCNGTTNHHENLWEQIDKVKPHVLYHIEAKKYICINTVKTYFAQ